MEPQKKDQNKDIESSTMGDLHDQGIDVLDSTRVAEDNEFGAPETEAAMADAPAPFDAYREPIEQDAPAVTPAVAQPKAAYVPAKSSLVPPMPGSAKAPAAPAAAPTPAPAPAAAPQPAASQPIVLTEDSFKPGGMNSSMPTNPAVKNDPSIKPLRTFKTDAEEAVRYQNISTAQMVVAEQKRRETSSTPIQYEGDRRPFPILLVAALLLVVLVAGGGAYWWLSLKAPAPRSNLPANLVVRTIVPYDGITTVTLDPESDPVALAAAALDDASVNIGEIYAVIPLPFGTTTAIASPSALLAETKIPGRLIRSLSPEYMLGSYVFNRNAPFLILKDTFFQNAYAGMLEWEGDMRNDLIKLIRVAHPDETPATVDGDVFEDSVVANVDARVLRGSEGQPILAYAFPDQNTIVLATDLETLRHLIDRLLSVRVVQ